jgi:DnaJ-class molecular chaperone
MDTAVTTVTCKECAGSGRNGTDPEGHGYLCRVCDGTGRAVVTYAALPSRPETP